MIKYWLTSGFVLVEPGLSLVLVRTGLVFNRDPVWLKWAQPNPVLNHNDYI